MLSEHKSNEKEIKAVQVDPSQYFLAQLSTICSSGAFRVVLCPLCVVNNFIKHLPNRWANLDKTWQECSLGCPLQKLCT